MPNSFSQSNELTLFLQYQHGYGSFWWQKLVIHQNEEEIFPILHEEKVTKSHTQIANIFDEDVDDVSRNF